VPFDAFHPELAVRSVITWQGLRAAGISYRHLQRLLEAGHLARCGRGVYAITSCPADPAARWRARAHTQLALAGTDAVLARAAAAAAWGLDGFRPGGEPIECNVPRRTSGKQRVPARRVESLEPPDRVDGLAVTSIGQTLVELGSTGTTSPIDPLDRVELALESALRRRLITIDAITELAAAAGRRRGAPTLRQVLERRPAHVPPTESYLETRMVQLLRRHGLPDPERQVEVFDRTGRIGRVDFLLGRLAMEVDGRAYHDNAEAYHGDRLRWDRLQAAGYDTLLFTYPQVEFDPGTVAALVRDTWIAGGA
jgi:hypothetical protein